MFEYNIVVDGRNVDYVKLPAKPSVGDNIITLSRHYVVRSVDFLIEFTGPECTLISLTCDIVEDY